MPIILRAFGLQKKKKQARNDLVFVGYVGACCEKCAMYRERVYSRNGNDRRFPVLPKDLKESCCGLSKFPYTYELDKHPFYMSKADAIRHSNRPFIDDRTEQEIVNYQERMKKEEEDWQREKDRKSYEKLLSAIPEECPKSFASFRRMKKEGNELYADLKKKARLAGVRL